MKLLCVDTSGKQLGILLKDGEDVLYEKYINADRAYNRHIMGLIDEAFRAGRMKPCEVQVFAAVLGPGSFTGIRVGISVMKAMAHACGALFAGASSLDILAASVSGKKRRLWAVLDAGRNELYAGKYEGKKSGRYALLTRNVFVKKLKKGDTVSCPAGEGFADWINMDVPGVRVIENEKIDLKFLARIIESGPKPEAEGLYRLAPVYIRQPEAEARRKQKQMEERKK